MSWALFVGHIIVTAAVGFIWFRIGYRRGRRAATRDVGYLMRGAARLIEATVNRELAARGLEGIRVKFDEVPPETELH